MADMADLEIGLHRWDASGYAVELRFSQPNSDADVPPERGLANFDLDRLQESEVDAETYGRLLTDSLFAEAAVTDSRGKSVCRATATYRVLPAKCRDTGDETMLTIKGDGFGIRADELKAFRVLEKSCHPHLVTRNRHPHLVTFTEKPPEK